jgi:hypothetical protein
MLSLVPKLAPAVPPLDLRDVFASEQTKATVSRVVKYIGEYYERFSNRSENDRNSALFTVEEFDLLMPTETAYFDEIRLCEAILEHSAGRLSDSSIKAVLEAYIASHLWIYRNGLRSPKVGADVWSNCVLVHVYEPNNLSLAFTCNAVQSWLVWLLHPEIKLRVLRLNDE